MGETKTLRAWEASFWRQIAIYKIHFWYWSILPYLTVIVSTMSKSNSKAPISKTSWPPTTRSPMDASWLATWPCPNRWLRRQHVHCACHPREIRCHTRPHLEEWPWMANRKSLKVTGDSIGFLFDRFWMILIGDCYTSRVAKEDAAIAKTLQLWKCSLHLQSLGIQQWMAQPHSVGSLQICFGAPFLTWNRHLKTGCDSRRSVGSSRLDESASAMAMQSSVFLLVRRESQFAKIGCKIYWSRLK